MALIEMAKPDFRGNDDPETRIKRIENYLFMLDEQLRYMFTHIDEENMTDDLRQMLMQQMQGGNNE